MCLKDVNRKLKFVTYTLGISISYVIFGVLEEEIYKDKYVQSPQQDAETKEEFTFSVAFVALQTIVYTIFAKTIILIRDKKKNVTHQKYYFAVACFYVSAMVSSNVALKWITYTAQVVFKSSNPISVMFFGVLMLKKSHSIQKYCFVLMMVAGVGMFTFRKSKNTPKDDWWIGYVVIGASLVLDGLTGAAQDKMRSVSRPTTMQFMYYVNGWSSVLLISLMAVTGEGRDLIDFATKYKEVIWKLAAITAVGTIGQVFISAMVAHFGSLPLSIVTTLRKFISVLISTLCLGTLLTLQQWLAIGVIFSALMLDAVFGKKSSTKKETPDQDVEKISEQSTTTVVVFPAVID